MDDLRLRSPDSLRPLQPLLSSVAENASNLAASVKHQHQYNDHEDHQHEHNLNATVEARSLQPLQSAVADYDPYELHQHQHQHQHQNQDQSEERQFRPEDAYGSLMVSTAYNSICMRYHH
jgi:predicted ATPase